MLPDCECKGRAFLHSLQEITEKKCEKISFAPILPLHSIAKSALKPIFSPLPHPIFFAPKSPFFPLFPVLNPISGDFSRDSARFLPCEAHFFLVFPHFGADFGHLFERSHPLLSPHFSFRTARILFRFGFSLSSSSTPPSYFPLISFPPFIPPPSSLTPPLSVSFFPTFPSPSPINARSRALSRNTRVRVRPHASARQEIFVYSLHLFTYPSQSTVHQHVRGEGKQEKAFTKCTIPSQSTH